MWYGMFIVYGYCDLFIGVEYFVLVSGWFVSVDVVVWLYLECFIGDVFGLLCCDCGV